VFGTSGYLVKVRPGELDVEEFQRLTDHGRQLLAAGKVQEASDALAAALALWWDRPFACGRLAVFRAAAARLEERRIAALEDRIEADLRLGRHAGLVAELQPLVAEQPRRERLRGQLMLACIAAGGRPRRWQPTERAAGC
jgi:DNA-binding SARP family transcriptional activator